MSASGRPIDGSPFPFCIEPGPPHGGSCTFTPLALRTEADGAFGDGAREDGTWADKIWAEESRDSEAPQMVAGRMCGVRIRLADACGNALCSGGAAVLAEVVYEGAVAISVAHSSEADCTRREGGSTARTDPPMWRGDVGHALRSGAALRAGVVYEGLTAHSETRARVGDGRGERTPCEARDAGGGACDVYFRPLRAGVYAVRALVGGAGAGAFPPRQRLPAHTFLQSSRASPSADPPFVHPAFLVARTPPGRRTPPTHASQIATSPFP